MEQTAANLEFFQWMHDEYGLVLDIYAFDAGAVDAPRYYGSPDTRKFRGQFPGGFGPVAEQAKGFGGRLGVWLGPDGFGDTPEEEEARIEFLTSMCRDHQFQLFKMDAVCGQLREEKQDAFVRLMESCRKHSPDLILLNHRLALGKAEPHATTFLWQGAETYIDVHMVNRGTATHNRAGALGRGLPPGALRERAGVAPGGDRAWPRAGRRLPLVRGAGGRSPRARRLGRQPARRLGGGGRRG